MRVIRRRIRKIKRFLSSRPILRRTLIISSSLLCLVVVVLCSLFFKQHAFEKSVYAAQDQAVHQVQKKLKTAADNQAVKADYSAEDVQMLKPNDMKEVNVDKQIDTYGQGLLEIPAISLTLPIVEGVTQANLSIGASTAKQGQQVGKRNFVLLGHYMTNRGLLFGGIRYLQKGNDIHVTYQGKQATYEVQEVKVISNHEVKYMEDTKQDNGVLTLITCDSTKDQTPNRLIVRAQVKK